MGAFFLIIFAISVQQLWSRVATANRESPPALFYFKPINQVHFIFSGRSVDFSDEVAEDGTGEVTIRYADAELVLPISIPERYVLPGLASHDDWMRVLLMREGEGFDPAQARAERRAGTAEARCLIVTRHQRPGTNPETFGKVFKSDWKFGFYELDPDGGINTLPRLAYPESKLALLRRQSAARKAGKPIPDRIDLELKAGTWQFQSAMFVMPAGSVPNGLPARPSIDAVGWTLPVASVSMVIALLSIAMAFAPSREDGEGEE